MERPPSERAVVLSVFRDLLQARSAREVEAYALTAARTVLQADIAIWIDVDGDALQPVAVSGLVQPEPHDLLRIQTIDSLSGRVIALGEPVASVDYADDPGVVTELRTLLRHEGVVSVLGAPMNGADRVEGILVVMSRVRREFASEERHVLLALAGVALAMRHQARQRADLADQVASLSERVASAGRLQRASDALATELLRGESSGHSLAAASAALGSPLHLDDAAAPGGSGADAPRTDAPRTDAPGMPPSKSAPVPGADRLRLVVSGDVSPSDLGTLARIVGLDLARQRASAETELMLTDQFIHALLAADGEEVDRLWRRSSLLGMGLDVPRALVCIGQDTPIDRRLMDRIQREMRARVLSGQLTTFDGDAILLWPVPDRAAEDRLPGQVSDIVEACRPHALVAGIGPVCRVAADYPAAAREAIFARQTTASSGGRRAVARSSDLGTYRLFAHIGDARALRDSVAETLAPLIEADERADSDLVRTLIVYLENECRLAETARVLHVHVNTLRYRIERISKLLSKDLQDSDDRFFVRLALRLRPLVEVSQPG